MYKGGTAEERIARGIAPVKPEFLRAVQERTQVDVVTGSNAAAEPSEPPLKKSKNQQKRDRAELKRVGQVCHNFLAGRCTYGDGCRFNHDLAAYLRSKPADLPGACIFRGTGQPCPYGITCRYATSHPDYQPPAAADGEEAAAAPAADADAVELPALADVLKPVNNLEKGVQQQLWKRKYDFSKADAVLKELGVKPGKHNRPGPAAGKDGQTADNKADESKPDGEEGSAAAQHGDAAGPSADLVAEASAADGAAAAAAAPLTGVKRGAPEPKSDASLVAALAAADEAETRANGTAGAHENMLERQAQHTETPLPAREKPSLDLRGKLYLAPLTTVGNLPFRRVCKGLGADVTIGEMALATNLLQGQPSEWALLKRHPSEDLFGVQIAGGYADAVTRCCQLIDEHCDVSFVDLNMGCPIDLVCDRGAGSALMLRPAKMAELVKGASRVLSCPLTVKMRKGFYDDRDVAHTILPNVTSWGAAAATLHGRTRQQRYSRQADWKYVHQCAEAAPGLQLVGNGDVFAYTDYNEQMASGKLATCMIARGALIKPWIFTEIKEQRHWDISAGERLDLLKNFCSFGLEHFGADAKGVESTRRFLLEWLSYLHRYIPVGLLEVVPQRMHWRPPAFAGRSDLETLMASDNAADWVRISEMLLGPVPPGFTFQPKHKSNAYATEAG